MSNTYREGQRIRFCVDFLSPSDELVRAGDTGTVRRLMMPKYVSVVDDKYRRVWMTRVDEIEPDDNTNR